MNNASLYTAHRIVVCMGDGGVGKTSVAAAMAIAAARAGRRVLVLTIDPSRRLAQALGFDDEALAQGVGITTPAAVSLAGVLPDRLFAQWLDVQATFDGIIRRRASTQEAADRIIDNKIYQQFSRSLAGSHEYAAVEKLYEVHSDLTYDVIILDTPPSQNAMDFLGAPRRILDFLENGRLSKMIEHPMWQKRGIKRLFDVGQNLVTKTLDGVVGAETMREIGAFLFGLREMYDGFRERALAIEELLKSQNLAYLVVGTAGRSQRATLETLAGALTEAGARPSAIVINRMPPALENIALPARGVESSEAFDEGREELEAAWEELKRRAAEAYRGAEKVRAAFPSIPLTLCPEAPSATTPVETVLSLIDYFAPG